MIKNKIILLSCLLVCGWLFSVEISAQQKTLLKKTSYQTESVEFGAGGTLTIVGAPQGTIIVEGWNQSRIEVSAEIVVEAETEADLAELSKVNGFVFDSDAGHVRLLSVGVHDKDYMKKTAKKFPKRLLNTPWKIDYRIKVPTFCDLEINSGKGDLKVSGIEGSMIIKAGEANADLSFTGGAITAVFGSGTVNVKIPTRSWRGRHADIQLGSGTLNVQLQQNLNANVSASILREGKIENTYPSIKPLTGVKFTEKSLVGKAGNGGAYLIFTVGAGNLNITP